MDEDPGGKTEEKRVSNNKGKYFDTCKRGHDMSKAKLFLNPDGTVRKRQCLECRDWHNKQRKDKLNGQASEEADQHHPGS